MQQHDRLVRSLHRLHGAHLRRGERARHVLARDLLIRIAQNAPLFERDASLFDERVDGGAELLSQFRCVRLAVLAQIGKARRLLRCVFSGDFS